MKKSLVFLLALFTCLMVVGCDSKKKTKANPGSIDDIINNGNTNVDPNNGNTNVNPNNGNNVEGDATPVKELYPDASYQALESIKLSNGFKDLSLTKENEKYKINDLVLDFYGVDVSSTTGVTNSYQYVLKLVINEIQISSNVFSNPSHRLINSDNLASKFTIYAVDDLYLLYASTGAQIDGESLLIIDKKGNFINSYEDCDFTIDIKNHKFDLTNCIYNTPDEECYKASYKLTTDNIELLS